MYVHPWRQNITRKLKFYTEVNLLLGRINNNKIKILMGNMNTDVAKERFFRPTIGSYSLHYIANDIRMKSVNLEI